MCVHIHAQVAVHMCGGQRTTFRRKIFLPLWVPGIELMLSGCVARELTQEPFDRSWSEVFPNQL